VLRKREMGKRVYQGCQFQKKLKGGQIWLKAVSKKDNSSKMKNAE